MTNPSLMISTDSITTYGQLNGIRRLAVFGSAVREDFTQLLQRPAALGRTAQ